MTPETRNKLAGMKDETLDFMRGYHAALKEAHTIVASAHNKAKRDRATMARLFGIFRNRHHFRSEGAMDATDSISRDLTHMATDVYITLRKKMG